MTDQDENRPLSRRELRLREMAAAGLQTEAAQAHPGPGQVSNETAEPAEPEFQVEIPLLDENGNPRSRRELRELREQAIAELKAAAANESIEESPDDSDFHPELAETVAFDVLADSADTAEPAEPEQSAEEPESVATSEETAFDALLQQATAEEAAAIEQDELFDEPAASVVPADPVEMAHEDGSTESDLDVDAEAELEADEAPVVAEAEVVEVDDDADADANDEAVSQEDAEVQEVADPEAKVEAASASEESFHAPAPAATGQAYSFPDITPLDDGQSIFDDPAVHVIGGAPKSAGAGGEGGHDFDELITRAVAQEGAASTTNTSALILPVMPETDALSGPIGETGELFITGSFDLPRSLSETGGHASLHDSVDAEPFDELGFVEPTPTGTMAPVSASRAVSARANQGPLVADATRDKNKLPVVLIATGGVLVLGATGLIIWAATSGLFG